MYSIEPVGFVRNTNLNTADDFWGDLISEMSINDKISEKSLRE